MKLLLQVFRSWLELRRRSEARQQLGRVGDYLRWTHHRVLCNHEDWKHYADALWLLMCAGEDIQRGIERDFPWLSKKATQ